LDSRCCVHVKAPAVANRLSFRSRQVLQPRLFRMRRIEKESVGPLRTEQMREPQTDKLTSVAISVTETNGREGSPHD
jgi:hypothetical protein